MKKLFKLTFAIVAILAFNACKHGDKPEAVAEKFINHLNKMEIDEAKKFATSESAATLDLLKTFAGDQKPQGEVKPVTIKESKEDGDKATVTYNDGTQDQQISLVKVDGDWKVEFKKENPMGGDMNATPSDSTTTTEDTTAQTTPAPEEQK